MWFCNCSEIEWRCKEHVCGAGLYLYWYRYWSAFPKQHVVVVGTSVEKVYQQYQHERYCYEAILFDMYYMAKDPVPLAGEKEISPKVELLPVQKQRQFQGF